MGLSAQNLPHPDSLHPDQVVQLWMPSKHMGNLLVSLRSIAALLKHYSQQRCVLVIDATYREIMAAANLPAEILYFPRKEIDNSSVAGKISGALKFIRSTRKPKPSIAIAIEGDKVSQRFLPLSGSPLSIGPDNKYCRQYRLRLPLEHSQEHVFYDYEAVARQITGEPLTPGYIELAAAAAETRQVAELLGEKFEHAHRPYAIIHPCATKDYKQWPVANFARLAEYLHDNSVNVAVTGAGDFDKSTIEQLISECRTPLLSLHNRLSLSKLIALMSGALFFIGNDTGPTHLAACSGTETLAIFGPTNEFLWGPMGPRTKILRSSTPCEPDCLRRRCSVNYRCMRTLEPATVIEHVKGLL